MLCFRGLGRMRVVIFACLVLGMVGGTWLQSASRRLRLLYLPGMHQPTADSNVAQVSLGCCSRRCSRSFVRALLLPSVPFALSVLAPRCVSRCVWFCC